MPIATDLEYGKSVALDVTAAIVSLLSILAS